MDWVIYQLTKLAEKSMTSEDIVRYFTDYFKGEGLDIWCPWRVVSGVKTPETYTEYVFVEYREGINYFIDRCEILQQVLTSSAGLPEVISGADVRAIFDSILPKEEYTKGQEVLIVSGPYSGSKGIIQEVEDKMVLVYVRVGEETNEIFVGKDSVNPIVES